MVENYCVFWILLRFRFTVRHLLRRSEDILYWLLYALRRQIWRAKPRVLGAKLLQAFTMQCITECLIFGADLRSEVFIQVARKTIVLWAVTSCSFWVVTKFYTKIASSFCGRRSRHWNITNRIQDYTIK